MMDNSWKYVRIDAKGFSAKFLNGEDIYYKGYKSGSAKISVQKKIDKMLHDAFKHPKTREKVNYIPFEIKIPHGEGVIEMVYDWDKIGFKRGDRYENVYQFDCNFIQHLMHVKMGLMDMGVNAWDIFIIDHRYAE